MYQRPKYWHKNVFLWLKWFLRLTENHRENMFNLLVGVLYLLVTASYKYIFLSEKIETFFPAGHSNSFEFQFDLVCYLGSRFTFCTPTAESLLRPPHPPPPRLLHPWSNVSSWWLCAAAIGTTRLPLSTIS